jgi:C4-dicarboxylate-binding protein DctP
MPVPLPPSHGHGLRAGGRSRPASARTLPVAFAAVAFTFVLAIAVTQIANVRIRSMAEEITGNTSPTIATLSEMRATIRRLETALVDFVDDCEDGRLPPVPPELQALRTKLHADWERYRQIPTAPGERGTWPPVENALRDLDAETATVLELAPREPLAAETLFRRRAEELTGGRVRVEVHPDGTLYRDKDEIEALQLGAVQMLAPSLSKFGPLGVTEFEVFDLPFIFEGEEQLRAVTEGPVGRRLLERLEPKGIRGLAYWDNGFKSFSASRPLRVPADFRGLRMRVQSSVVLEEEMRALGAVPLVLGFSDVRAALEAGVVDGTENPISNFFTQRMHELQRHVLLSRHGYLGYAVIVNMRFWDGLPRDLRRHLEQALREATEFANRTARENNEAFLARLRAAGTTEVHVPTPEERAALRRALLPVHRRVEARVGRELLREIYAATRFDPDRM